MTWRETTNSARDRLAVSLDGNWGVAEIRGDNLIPFIFEDLVFIDDNTAFAKYGGKYGILDLTRTAAGQ